MKAAVAFLALAIIVASCDSLVVLDEQANHSYRCADSCKPNAMRSYGAIGGCVCAEPQR